jgi:hypothetical protein
MSIDDTIREREETHGRFQDNASTSQRLKAVVRTDRNLWMSLEPIHRESIDMVFHKIARIINGDAGHADHWHDIAGYATLVEQYINKEANNGNGHEAEKKSY